MRLVIHTNYYDFCDSWDTEVYIEYESAEQFYVDFCDWCKEHSGNHDLEGFLGLGLQPINLTGNENCSKLSIYTWEEWWERNVIRIRGE